LGLARIDTEVGPECFAGARSWPPVGTRFAILGFSHSLSLQLTRLACGKLERVLPARMRENGWSVARAAGQLPLASSGCCAKLEAVRRWATRIPQARETMFREIHTRGEWWLPSAPEVRIPGLLDFTTRDGAKLSLSGNLAPTGGHHIPDFILGSTLDGDQITLCRCERIASQELPFAGVSASDYHASFVFAGIHFDRRDSLLLDAVHIHYTHLNEWLHLVGFDFGHEEKYDFSINYKRPEGVTASVTQDLSVSIGFICSQGGSLYAVHAEQDSYLSLRGPASGYQYYEKYVELLQNLLCLACSSPIYPCIIQLSPAASSNPDETRDHQARLINLSYQISTAPADIPDISFHHMLFTYDHLKGRFEEFIRNWITKYELLGPVFDLYFGSINNPYSYTTHRFLNIVQGLESYHRRSFDSRAMPEKEFENRKQLLAEAFPQYRKWLDWKLRFANEPPLEQRLIELGDKYKPSIVPMVGAYDKFFNRVATTRNYLTHFDEESRSKAATGGELRGMVQTLTLFLETFLLTELGFKYDEVVQMQRNRRRLPYW